VRAPTWLEHETSHGIVGGGIGRPGARDMARSTPTRGRGRWREGMGWRGARHVTADRQRVYDVSLAGRRTCARPAAVTVSDPAAARAGTTVHVPPVGAPRRLRRGRGSSTGA